MTQVVIGMDPHKRSATIEVVDERERVLAAGRFGTDREGYRQLLAAGRQYPERLWAVEGCQGVGRHLAQRLVADGEPVVDVPSKLSARARVFATGQGRKTDATDAHSVAVVALRSTGLQVVAVDDETVALRLLADRRDELGAARTIAVNRLHRLLVELIPGGAKQHLSADQAKRLLATVRPRDVVGQTRRQLASELVEEVGRVDKKKSGLPTSSCANSWRPQILGFWRCSALARRGLRGYLAILGTSAVSLPATTSRHGTAPPPSTLPPATRSTSGCPDLATAASTECCTRWPSSNFVTTAKAAPTTDENWRRARLRWRQCGPSSGGYRTSSTSNSSPIRNANSRRQKRARVDTWGRLLTPALPATTPVPALRINHFPDPPRSTLRRSIPPFQTVALPDPERVLRRRPARATNAPIDTEGCRGWLLAPR